MLPQSALTEYQNREQEQPLFPAFLDTFELGLDLPDLMLVLEPVFPTDVVLFLDTISLPWM